MQTVFVTFAFNITKSAAKFYKFFIHIKFWGNLSDMQSELIQKLDRAIGKEAMRIMQIKEWYRHQRNNFSEHRRNKAQLIIIPLNISKNKYFQQWTQYWENCVHSEGSYFNEK